MTIDRETVIRLAEEAGALIESWMTQPPKPSLFYMSPEQLERFAALVLEQERKPLTDEQIERLREKTFSTNNPYCPVPKYHGRFSTKDPNGQLNYYEFAAAIEREVTAKLLLEIERLKGERNKAVMMERNKWMAQIKYVAMLAEAIRQRLGACK